MLYPRKKLKDYLMMKSAEEYRESLRALKPRIYLGGSLIESVADEPRFEPGINATGITYDFALVDDLKSTMTTSGLDGKPTNRFLAINRSRADLQDKLEAVRLTCKVAGCAQRYLTHDAFNALFEATWLINETYGGENHARLLDYIQYAQTNDLSIGIAMTDGKGDRSKRPSEQDQPDSYVHVIERRSDGIVISGVKAIITGGPYMHELLVMPCRRMDKHEKDFAVACAVPIDAAGITIVSRPAGRPGNPAAKFSAKFAQAVAVAHFDNVFVPYDRVFIDGETEEAHLMTTNYATHHRHSCIGARAGFGDLLIGAGAMMAQANGLDYLKVPHLREKMVELIKITEGFYACGIASSTMGVHDAAGNFRPDQIYANIGKLLLANQIYDMHRLAHDVSGGLVVALPGPEEDHNPVTSAILSDVLRGHPDVPYEHRANVSRFIEDLTASETGGWYSVISLHGGGSPEAMKLEILRNYDIEARSDLVQALFDRGALEMGKGIKVDRQPGRCCAKGCQGDGLVSGKDT
jgi:4-hydroxybutyryl-CoA dehydratase/vinylacetyl-CoA-Delta-isomerase|tara:strand:- start:272 stop:1837 length:1566 start_codon:yes stop_codon:yes gene_type:complete